MYWPLSHSSFIINDHFTFKYVVDYFICTLYSSTIKQSTTLTLKAFQESDIKRYLYKQYIYKFIYGRSYFTNGNGITYILNSTNNLMSKNIIVIYINNHQRWGIFRNRGRGGWWLIFILKNFSNLFPNCTGEAKVMILHKPYI
jgi:hypothetical protein